MNIIVYSGTITKLENVITSPGLSYEWFPRVHPKAGNEQETALLNWVQLPCTEQTLYMLKVVIKLHDHNVELNYHQ